MSDILVLRELDGAAAAAVAAAPREWPLRLVLRPPVADNMLAHTRDVERIVAAMAAHGAVTALECGSGIATSDVELLLAVPTVTALRLTDCNMQQPLIGTVNNRAAALVAIELDWCRFLEGDPSRLGAIAARATALRTLSLSHCSALGDGGVVAIAPLVRHLTTLRLIGCGVGTPGLEAIVGALPDKTALQHVCLALNQIDRGGAAVLASIVRRSTSLVELELRGNAVGDDGAAAVCAAVQGSSIRHLGLASNKIGVQPGSLAAVSSLLAGSAELASLDLSLNSINSDGLQYFADALGASTTLQSLDLSSNQLGATTGDVLFNILSRNKSLRTLDLSSNDLHNSVHNVFNAIAGHQGCRLEMLALRNNGIDRTGVQAETEMLHHLFMRNQTLRSLDLSVNQLGRQGVRDVLLALRENRTLTTINLAFNVNTFHTLHGVLRFDGEDSMRDGVDAAHDDVVAALELLRHNFTLTKIDMTGRSPPLVEAVERALGVNRILCDALPDLLQHATKAGALEALLQAGDRSAGDLLGLRDGDLAEALAQSNGKLANVVLLPTNVQSVATFVKQLSGPGQICSLSVVAEYISLQSLGELLQACVGVLRKIELPTLANRSARDLVLQHANKSVHVTCGVTSFDLSSRVDTTNVFLLGYGGVGKSSLRASLQGGVAERFTHLLECDYDVQLSAKGRQFNLFDVGGQEHYHSGWHLALESSRSIFVIVIDSRRETYKSHLQYFLRLVASRRQARRMGSGVGLATEPRVVVVFSYKSEASRQHGLQARTKQLQDFVVEQEVLFRGQLSIERIFHWMDCNNVADGGLPLLKKRLTAIADELDKIEPVLGSTEVLRKLRAVVHAPTKPIFMSRDGVAACAQEAMVNMTVDHVIDTCCDMGLFLRVAATPTGDELFCVNLQRFGQEILARLFEGDVADDRLFGLHRYERAAQRWTHTQLAQLLRSHTNTGGERIEVLIQALLRLKLCCTVGDRDNLYMFPALAHAALDVNAARQLVDKIKPTPAEAQDAGARGEAPRAPTLAMRFSTFISDPMGMFSPLLLPQVVCQLLNSMCTRKDQLIVWREGLIAAVYADVPAGVTPPSTPLGVVIVHMHGMQEPQRSRERATEAPRMSILDLVVCASSTTDANDLMVRAHEEVVRVLAEYWCDVLYDALLIKADVKVAELLSTRPISDEQQRELVVSSIAGLMQHGPSLGHALRWLWRPNPLDSELRVTLTAGRFVAELHVVGLLGNSWFTADEHFRLVVSDHARTGAVQPDATSAAIDMLPNERLQAYTCELPNVRRADRVFLYTFHRDGRPFLAQPRVYDRASPQPGPRPYQDPTCVVVQPSAQLRMTVAGAVVHAGNTVVAAVYRSQQLMHQRVQEHRQQLIQRELQANEARRDLLLRSFDGVQLCKASYAQGDYRTGTRLWAFMRDWQSGMIQWRDVATTQTSLSNAQPVYCYVQRGPELWIAVRGSRTGTDWLHNFRMVLTKLDDLPGKVHTGFKLFALSVLHDIIDERLLPGDGRPHCPLHLCGHSLGGATAIVLALLIKTRLQWTAPIHVTTVGAPMIGDPDLVKESDRLLPNVHQFVNVLDPVPQLLARDGVGFARPSCVHVLDGSGELRTILSENHLRNVLSGVRALFVAPLSFVAWHSVNTYYQYFITCTRDLMDGIDTKQLMRDQGEGMGEAAPARA